MALCQVALGQIAEALGSAEQAQRLLPDDETVADQYQRLQKFYLQQREAARLAAERALQLATKQMQPAWVGTEFTQQLQAKGGAGGPYTIALAADASLPRGLVLDADGRIHGTPEEAGLFSVGLVLIDQGPTTENARQLEEGREEGKAQAQIELVVLPTPNLLTTQLPDALLDEPYEAQLEAEGFIAPKWRIEGLPSGMSLRVGLAAQASRSQITGQHDQAGTIDLTIHIEDAYHHQTFQRSLTILDAVALLAVSELPGQLNISLMKHVLLFVVTGAEWRSSSRRPTG